MKMIPRSSRFKTASPPPQALNPAERAHMLENFTDLRSRFKYHVTAVVPASLLTTTTSGGRGGGGGQPHTLTRLSSLDGEHTVHLATHTIRIPTTSNNGGSRRSMFRRKQVLTFQCTRLSPLQLDDGHTCAGSVVLLDQVLWGLGGVSHVGLMGVIYPPK